MFRFFFALVHRWKLNDSFIHPRPGSRHSLVGGNLHISRLNKDEDVGIYQCLGSNSFGTIVSREASLHVACECCRRVSAVSTFWPTLTAGRIVQVGVNLLALQLPPHRATFAPLCHASHVIHRELNRLIFIMYGTQWSSECRHFHQHNTKKYISLLSGQWNFLFPPKHHKDKKKINHAKLL